MCRNRVAALLRGFAPLFAIAGMSLALITVAMAASTQVNSTQTRQPEKFIYVNTGGGVKQTKTPSVGKVHLSGDFSVDTASYSNGTFNGDTKDLNDLVLAPSLRATFALPKNPIGFLQHSTVTFGVANSVSTNEKLPSTSTINAWNHSSYVVGFGAEVAHGWLAALSYAYYTNPSAGTTSDQVTLTMTHTDWWKPSAKIKIPAGSGYNIRMSVAPAWPLHGSSSWTLTVPMAIGVGIDDYYGQGTDTAGYFSLEFEMSKPLKFMSPAYGNWTLSASVRAIVRSDDLRTVGPPLASTDTVIPIGTVSLSFAY